MTNFESATANYNNDIILDLVGYSKIDWVTYQQRKTSKDMNILKGEKKLQSVITKL